MRKLLSTLAVILVTGQIAGCRSQTTGMTNPFLAPDRVPPPATRTLLPGTAQPYYPGDPVPNSPAINTPPAGYPAGTAPQPGYQPPSTYAPQPAGALPPGGWNGAAQPNFNGASSSNVLPSIQPTVQPTVAVVPSLPVVPLPPQQQVSPYPNQVAVYQQPQSQQIQAQQPFVQPSSAVGGQREVRIRAISSSHLDTNNGQPVSRDGFRPQGSSQVRKPTIASRLVPRKRVATLKPSNRYGFDPQYSWLRGQLQHSPTTGQLVLRYEDPKQENWDSFDGNLTVANPEVLGSMQPGDFVLLRGQVDQTPGVDGVAVPSYRVSVVQRQQI